jgi:hypothetical protein
MREIEKADFCFIGTLRRSRCLGSSAFRTFSIMKDRGCSYEEWRWRFIRRRGTKSDIIIASELILSGPIAVEPYLITLSTDAVPIPNQARRDRVHLHAGGEIDRVRRSTIIYPRRLHGTGFR